MTDVPLILVSNDDGVTAHGLAMLTAAVEPLGEVWVVAPDREQSGAGHSISLARSLRAERLAARRFSVDGTPTDCVYLALHHLLPRRPALVVSGINMGANLGNDVTYSGTVSAAMEGTLFDVPSIAFSQLKPKEADWPVARQFASRLSSWVLQNGLPQDTLLSVNFPPKADLERVRWARLGKRRYGNAVDVRTDPRGRTYYWIGGEEIGSDDIPGSDCNFVQEGYISVSPVHLDLTNDAALAKLRDTLI